MTIALAGASLVEWGQIRQRITGIATASLGRIAAFPMRALIR